MANETTTATADDLTHASLVQPVLIKALSARARLYRFARQFNLIGQATNAAKIPVQTSWWGSAADRGAGVDTEFNATEGSALGNTAVSTSSVTCTAAEYGVQITVTDNVNEDSVSGIDLAGTLPGTMMDVMTLCWEDDYLALLASLSNTVGSSGVDLTVAQLIAANTGLRVRETEADRTEIIFDHEQASNFEGLMVATSTSMAVYAMAADRVIAWQPTSDHGLSNRVIAGFRGSPVNVSGLTDTANAGADVVGAVVCPSTAVNDSTGATTHAMAIKRLPRFRMDNSSAVAIGGRGTIMVMDSRVGFAELQDGSGTAIITDAP